MAQQRSIADGRELAGTCTDVPLRNYTLTLTHAAALLGHRDHRCPRCLLLREKLHLIRKIYASGGGLLAAPIFQ